VTRRVVSAMCLILLLSAVCGAQQTPIGAVSSAQHQPGIPLVDHTPTPMPSFEGLAAFIAQQIEKKHLKNVIVIGVAGPKADEPTQFGLELGDKFSAALARQSKEFQVGERGQLRDFVKKNRVSDVMVVSDALANWIAAKVGAGGYVLLKFLKVSNAEADVEAILYGTDKDDGKFLEASNTTIDLSADEYLNGFRAIDSDWNKETYTREEYKQLPPDRQPSCISCPTPQYTQAGRKERATNEMVEMDLTVFPDGTAGDIAIIKSARYGLTASSLETILQKWKFKPALDADGKAMAVRVPVETLFQLY
jgi:hypothetical protein